MILSHLIECECLLILGFRNAGLTLLRSAVEAAFKLLYYETHPVEWQLHQKGSHDLRGLAYREFLYSFPGLGEVEFAAKAETELLWTDLCKFVHSDLRAVSQVSVVADIQTALGLPGNEQAALLGRIQAANKLIIACCFAVDPAWLKGVEKAYFDAVFDTYTTAERAAVKEALRVV
jgi:hypothetical protein